ncbi:MAG: PadR family transcriptional regulator [Chloroflexi bacterium]|uniref:PadR family transcriptional regulator n=1 Tax=Candidatus Flexifilum breve TaxID=3140694 RepID=UPI0031374151|nr:PadR family transcriptional regulator [Chloroflexota bacterium]
MNALTPDETILGLLAAQGQHGYQLLETFQDPARLGKVWKLSTSQLYAVLKRLERQAWISGVEQWSESAPPRIEYSLTEAGWRVLDEWLSTVAPSASIRCVRVEFLSRLYIAQLLKLPTAPIIARQRAVCQAEYARLQSAQGNNPQSMGYLAAEMVITQLGAVLTWIDRCELVLQSTQT